MISEIKIDAITSKKMKELQKHLESIENEKSYTLFSPDQLIILNKKENKEKLNKMIDRKINFFINKYKRLADSNKIDIDDFSFSKDRMDEILKIYLDTIQSYHKQISKLEKTRNDILDKYIIKRLSKYKPKNKNEKTICFVPVLDQSIYDEYDINILIKRDIFSKEEQKEYASIFFEYDLEISKLYNTLLQYILDNHEIGYYDSLINIKKEINAKRILFTDKYINFLEKNKITISKPNYKSMYKDDVFLYNISISNSESFNKIKNKFINNFFRKDKYKKDYFQFNWITIEEYYQNEKYNSDLSNFISKKSKLLFKKDPNLKVLGNKKDIIIREEYRKDINIIRKGITELLQKWNISNIIDNTYISHYNYPNDKKVHEYIKIKD